MENFYSFKRILTQVSLVLLFSALTSTVEAQSYLEVPVKLEVEKGDLSNIVVKVKKDGKDAFTQSGASKMRFKLDYNKQYTLVFTKEGYITKTIEINTNAPADRINKGFDPYRIGVKLFTNDAQNVVVYNQPVAKIKYDQGLDEFNYETDYSKSILSAFNEPETKPEPAKKDSVVAVKETPKPEPIKVAPSKAEQETPPNKTIAENVKVDVKKEEAPKPQEIKTAPKAVEVSKPAAGQDEEKPKTQLYISGGDNLAQSELSSNQEQIIQNKPVSDQEKVVVPANKNGEDKQKVELPFTASTDKQPVVLSQSQGQDKSEDKPVYTENEKIVRQDIIEKNRVITKVTVTKGNKVVEYSRMNYSWGGNYFFRDNKTSISENYFVMATGLAD